jgi:hypothetical protein
MGAKEKQKDYDPGNGRNRTAVGSALLDFNLHNDTCYHYTTSPLLVKEFETGWPVSESWLIFEHIGIYTPSDRQNI